METIVKFIKIIVGISACILLLRLVLRLLGAKGTNMVIDFVYDISKPFVSPFSGVLDNITFGNRFVLELSTLFAIIAYVIIGLILIKMIEYFSNSGDKK